MCVNNLTKVAHDSAAAGIRTRDLSVASESLSTFHKLRRTNIIEINHWAKVANKTANINVQNRSLYAS